MPRLPACALAALALAASAPGCDAQADRDYLGEPLVTLRGQVAGDPPLPPLEAAMLWQRGPPPSTSDQELATRAPIEAGFPATFTVRLYQPPPAAARRTLADGEVSFARGNAAAVPYGTVTQSGPVAACAPGTSFSVDIDHWIIHLDRDVPASSLTAWWLGAALPAGYHLVKVTAVNPVCITPAELDACVWELVLRGVPENGSGDPGTARWWCLQPYRLAPAPPDELIVLRLGVCAPQPATVCP